MTGRLIAVVLLLVGTAGAQMVNGSTDAHRLQARAAREGDVDLNPGTNRDFEVRAKHTEDPDGTHWAANAAFVTVADLRVPANAAKEFEKASRFITKQDWGRATERLLRGLALYPNYAAGYNNLGAVYSQEGKNSQALEALQNAVALDDHLAPAYVNLGRLSFLENDFPGAEYFLTKAMSLAPPANADELFLLAYAELTDRHLDEALETSQRGHAARFNQHAFLHLVAANTYEQKRRVADSMSELQMYLSEEPNGPQAEKARRALATFQAQTAAR